jgi:PAS domain S-box-containing protein
MEKETETKQELIEDLADLHKQLADVKESRSETKKALQALQVSETRYRRLFETAQDGILILNAETGQIDDVNPYMIDMLHYSYGEFVGKKLWEVSSFKDTVLNQAAFKELQDKGYIRYKDLPLETVEGKPIAVEFVSNVYEVDGKKVIQCNIRNITERKEVQEALEEERRRLQQALDEVRTLRGILPICANCKKIRDDKGYWNQVEKYVSNHTEAKFSHGLCPGCIEILYPELKK